MAVGTPVHPNHTALHYHVFFGTRNLENSIVEAWQPKMVAFLEGAVRGLNAIPEATGAAADHVHILIGLQASHKLAEVVNEIKVCTSLRVHVDLKTAAFNWQLGYGAYTVSPSKLADVKAYVLNQAEIHRTTSFEDEYARLLQRSGVTYSGRNFA